MNSNIYNSIILSNEQVDYLMQGTAGINRLSCLFQLIHIVTRKIETSNKVEESATALWELNMSEVAISKLWKCDRKTVSKMLDNMNRLGILSSVQTRRGSVHTLLCISAWIVDGKKYVNPHYIPINQRESTCNVEASNKEGIAIGKSVVVSSQTNSNFSSSLSLRKDDNRIMGREEYEPSPLDLAIEDEAKRHLFNEHAEAESIQ